MRTCHVVCFPPELILEMVLHDWLFSQANGILFRTQQWALSEFGLAQHAIVPPSLVQYQSAMLLKWTLHHISMLQNTPHVCCLVPLPGWEVLHLNQHSCLLRIVTNNTEPHTYTHTHAEDVIKLNKQLETMKFILRGSSITFNETWKPFRDFFDSLQSPLDNKYDSWMRYTDWVFNIAFLVDFIL